MVLVRRSEEVTPQQFHHVKPRETEESDDIPQPKPEVVQVRIVWRNVIIFAILHLMSVYACFLVPSSRPLTWLFAYMLSVFGGLSITAGAHRLWSHRSYKARLPLRILLVAWNCIAGQNHIIEWCRDHRVHHKYSETDADPHNAKRGFFFAHVGWLLSRKHPEVIRKGKLLDFTDLYSSRTLRFQARFYVPLFYLGCYILPTLIPWLWGEYLWNAFFVCGVLRYVISLHMTWLINSAAHMWGMRPYDKRINPAENLLTTIGAYGEGFHNYHHTFPQDYATSEHGTWLNVTTVFINFMKKIGWAYDLRTISKEAILARKKRTGSLSDIQTQETGHTEEMNY